MFVICGGACSRGADCQGTLLGFIGVLGRTVDAQGHSGRSKAWLSLTDLTALPRRESAWLCFWMQSKLGRDMTRPYNFYNYTRESRVLRSISWHDICGTKIRKVPWQLQLLQLQSFPVLQQQLCPLVQVYRYWLKLTNYVQLELFADALGDSNQWFKAMTRSTRKPKKFVSPGHLVDHHDDLVELVGLCAQKPQTKVEVNHGKTAERNATCIDRSTPERRHCHG